MMRSLITLIAFAALASGWAQGEPAPDGQIRLHWQIDSANDNYGFYLNRSESPDGPWERVNEELIPGVGTTSEIHRFEFLDEGLVRGLDYHYQLYEVGFDGSETLMGTLPAHCRTVEEDIVHERLTALGESVEAMAEISAPLVNQDWLVFLHPRTGHATRLITDLQGWDESPTEMSLLPGTHLMVGEIALSAIPATAESISYLFLVGNGASAEARLDVHNPSTAESAERGQTVSVHILGAEN